MNKRKPSSDLLNLIKCLCEREIKYFSEYIHHLRIPEGDNFRELFMLIREQEEYDEHELKVLLTDRTWAKRFTYSKNELFNYVSDSLMHNTSKETTDREIHYLIDLAEKFKQKCLYKLALKKLDKAHEVAARYEKYYSLLNVLEARRRLLKQLPATDLQKQLYDINNQKLEIFEKIKNEEHYFHLNDKVYLLYREHNQTRDLLKQQELETIMQCPSLQNEKLAITFEAKLKFHYIHSLYNLLKADYKKALPYRKKVIDLWESNPNMIDEMPQTYRTDLANLLTVHHYADNYEGFEELIKKIETIKEGNIEEDAFTFRQVYHLKQLYLLNTGKVKEAYELIPVIKKGLEKYGELINPVRQHSFWYNNMMACFVMRKYLETIPWVNQILKPDIDKKVRTDIHDFVPILEVILYYETGKYDVVESKLRNTRDRLSYKNKLYDFEKVVLQNISKLIKAKRNKQDIHKVFTVFNLELQAIANSAGKEKLLGLEEIIIWVNTK